MSLVYDQNDAPINEGDCLVGDHGYVVRIHSLKLLSTGIVRGHFFAMPDGDALRLRHIFVHPNKGHPVWYNHTVQGCTTCPNRIACALSGEVKLLESTHGMALVH